MDPRILRRQTPASDLTRKYFLTYIGGMMASSHREPDVFGAISHPARRRMLDLLFDGGRSVNTIAGYFQMSRPAVSQHLKVLRENGFALVRPEGTRRLYAVGSAPLREVDEWLDQFRGFWNQRLDALGTELARGRRKRRTQSIDKKEQD